MKLSVTITCKSGAIMSWKSCLKGLTGEVRTIISNRLNLNPNTYKQIRDITIQGADGTTQLDHVIVSKFGIFIVESKNYKGWIFGSAQDKEWTQVIGKQKFKFQNPLRQNYRHIKALSTFLGVDESCFHSLVVFWGSCTFKTDMPLNVLKGRHHKYILSKQDVFFEDWQVTRCEQYIKLGMMPRGRETRRQHVNSLQKRHEKKAGQ